MKKESELIGKLRDLDFVSRAFPASVSMCIMHFFFWIVCPCSCLHYASARHKSWLPSTLQEFDHPIAFPELRLGCRLELKESGTSLTSLRLSNYSVITSRVITEAVKPRHFTVFPCTKIGGFHSLFSRMYFVTTKDPPSQLQLTRESR